jgi:nitrous oxidase accessory protein
MPQMLPILVIVLFAQADPALTMARGAPANLQGRPPAGQMSPLQTDVDAAAPGGTVTVAPGRYEGDLVIDKPLRLIGVSRPQLVGSGNGSVVRVRADDVTIDGFDIDGRGTGRVADDAAGIHVAARRATVRNCRISGSPFGVYLREADGSAVAGMTVEGIAGRDAGDQGSGIHLWNTTGFALRDNFVHGARDGVYLQASSHGVVVGNTIREVRYGLHYMYSDDNVFEDNTFERSAAGAALMYSRRLTFRRNRFVGNRGFASVGLLLNGCDDVVAEQNLIADNARGLFLEGSHGNRFRGNVVAESDAAIVLYDSSSRNRFDGNVFVANLTPLQLVGRRTDTVFDRNYWSDAAAPDMDGDGVQDEPYRLTSVFDHLRGNLIAADLFAQGLGAAVLARAERAFPVLDPVAAVDGRPLARAPVLAEVPGLSRPPRAGAAAGLVVSAGTLAVGILAHLTATRRRGIGAPRLA